jgi:Ca2+-binding EF-hand superfamily protein
MVEAGHRRKLGASSAVHAADRTVRPMSIAVTVLALLASSADGQPQSQRILVTGHAWAPFISPMGEPFRARAETDDTLARWFAQADGNQDGAITPNEMVADAERFFARLDTSHDGHIDPDELARYEWEVAPEIQAMSKTKRLPGQASPADTRPAEESDGLERPRDKRQEEQVGSLGLGGALQGAARYGLLNMPEPVAAADADFDRAVTLEEFKTAALERFRLLDRAHQGRLTLAELEAIRSEQLAQIGKRKHRNNVPDPRLGNPLPPGT